MGLENLKSVFNDLTKNVKEDFGGPHGQGVHGGLTNESPSTPPFPDENTTLDNTANGASIPPQVARVFPDNKSMNPTLQSGKGSQVGTSVFLDATGNSRFSIGEDPVATQPINFSILDNLPNIAGLRPDNQSMQPTLRSGKGSQVGNSIFLDATGNSRFSIKDTHPENYSILDNIFDNQHIGILNFRKTNKNKMNGILSWSSPNWSDNNPLIADAVGPNVGFDTFEELSNENIKKRKVDISNLGRNAKLGKGDFTLGTLFKHNHRGSPQRGIIDTGVIDPSKTDGSTIQINTGRAGIGSLANLDIKGYSTTARSGLLGPVAEGLFRIATLGLAGGISDVVGDFGKEPYVVRNIPESGNGIYGGTRDTIPFRAALDDVSRLAQFYTSPAGINFLARENVTNITFGTRGGGIEGVLTNSFDKIMAPPVPIPNTGFLNVLQQQIQGAGFGSIRKPFTIQYSDRFNIGSPYKALGDRIVGLTKILKQIEIKERDFIDKIPDDSSYFQKGKRGLGNLGLGAINLGLKGLKVAKSAAIETLNNIDIPELPMVTKPTDFIDTSGFGNHSDKLLGGLGGSAHGPKDVFATEASSLGTSVESDSLKIKKGDFYVRIKDLRTNKFLYFRGFITGIVENVSPNWSTQNYIGRSEPVYMYERADRDLSFNLKVYPQNATHQGLIYQNLETLTSLAYPSYMSGGSDYLRMKPPFTELYMAHIGTRKQGQFGFIKSLSYTVPEEGDWDALNKLPRLFDIAISYQILSKLPPSLFDGSMGHTNTFYGAGEE